MTQQEAKLFFPHDADDDLLDLYDERLFEFKQFFSTKVPVRKVFESKLNKLQQMQTAYNYLTGEEQSQTTISKGNITNVFNSEEVMTTFLSYEKIKSSYKQQLMIANDASTIYQIVMNHLLHTEMYWSKWHTYDSINIDIESLSKDSDPMEVLEAIRQFETAGGKKFEDIPKMSSQTFLLKEMKRLSLLHKNYGNVRSI